MRQRRERHPNQLPCVSELDEKSRQWVRRFLGQAIRQARQAKSRMRLAMQYDERLFAQQNHTYWKHALGGFRWLLGQFDRQITEDARRQSAAPES